MFIVVLVVVPIHFLRLYPGIDEEIIKNNGEKLKKDDISFLEGSVFALVGRLDAKEGGA